MPATTLPTAEEFTGAAVTEGQFKTALTSLHDFVAELQTQAADIASATTCNIGTSAGNYVKITGTTTITGFGTPTAAANTTRVVLFAGALTLTHNATSLILPGGVNITTAAGDVAMFVHEGSGNWRCLAFLPTGGYAKAAGSSAQDFALKILTAAGLLDISGAAAGQIKFPATQNASADANTLDDFEKGNWTPTATPITSGTITLSSSSGKYTKKGREVSLAGQLVVASASSPVGILNLGGLPFAGPSGGVPCSIYINGMTGMTTSIFQGTIVGTSIYIYELISGGSSSTAANRFTTSSELQVSITYHI